MPGFRAGRLRQAVAGRWSFHSTPAGPPAPLATKPTSRRLHLDQQPAPSKPFEQIPGPGPSLPLLGTNWIYSKLGERSAGSTW